MWVLLLPAEEEEEEAPTGTAPPPPMLLPPPPALRGRDGSPGVEEGYEDNGLFTELCLLSIGEWKKKQMRLVGLGSSSDLRRLV